jgi:peroxiredoxin
MRRRRAILLGSLIAATGIAAAATLTWPISPAVPPKAVTTSEAPAAFAGPDRVEFAKVEKAMKELDLIRPSPPKLAKDFTLKMPDGLTFRLSEQRGRVVFINFWATWCPPCREEMPALQRLNERTKKGRLVMLAVSVDGDPKVVTPFLEEHRFTFAIGLDPKMELANTYGVRALPASFIVDRDGYLVALALGPRVWDNAASQALVEGMSH